MRYPTIDPGERLGPEPHTGALSTEEILPSNVSFLEKHPSSSRSPIQLAQRRGKDVSMLNMFHIKKERLRQRAWHLLVIPTMLMLSVVALTTLSHFNDLGSPYEKTPQQVSQISLQQEQNLQQLTIPLYTRTLSANQGVHQEIDPLQVWEDPKAYDARACAARPSSENCDGLYPVAPPHVTIESAVAHGAGTCIDSKSKIVQTINLDPSKEDPLRNYTLRLWWLPTCKSFFADLSFTFLIKQVRSATVLVRRNDDMGLLAWLDTHPITDEGDPYPFFYHVQQSGPVDFTKQQEMLALELQSGFYSPLIYSPSAPVRAEVDIELVDGTRYPGNTDYFIAGIAQ